MRYLTLIFYISLHSVCFAKDSIKIKLLEPLPLNGQEQIIKGEATFEGEKVQVIGKGKGEYSKQMGGIITNIAISHIVLPGKEPKLSALKKPYLTSFKTKSASQKANFNQGKTLTLNLDSQDLRLVLEKGKQGEISQALTSVAKHTSSTERQVDLVDAQAPSGSRAHNQIRGARNNLKGNAKTSEYPLNSGEGGLYSNLENGSKKPSESSERRGGSASERSNSDPRHFNSGRGPGWANISQGAGVSRERRENQGESSQRTPTITTESSEEGCMPSIDKIHHRVTIQKRVITKSDGVITNPGQCKDTLENYPIEKDYRCEGCRRLVSEADKAVYPHYKAYWIKHSGEKVYIDASPQLDRENSYGFVEERDTCPPDIDFDRNRAFPQLRLVYLDRWNTKHEIRTCSRIEGHEGFPIEWIKEGCTLTHQFNNNRSKEMHRAIFKVGSSIHEAKRCEATGNWLQHSFVKAQCRPMLDLHGGLITPTARRQITTGQGPQMITEECEPQETSHLQQTREGCEAKYFHDWPAGKSYFKKRYYYDNEGAREFVSPCLRTAEFVNHVINQTRFEHDDTAKVSQPLSEISIDGPEGRVQISPAQLRNVPPTPYVLLREEERISLRRPDVQGAIRSFQTDRVNIWKRPDESLFEEIVEIGSNPVQMEADFQTEIERRTIPIRTEISDFTRRTTGGTAYAHGAAYWSEYTSPWCLSNVTSTTDAQYLGKSQTVTIHGNHYKVYKPFYALQQREVKVYESGLRVEEEWFTMGETATPPS